MARDLEKYIRPGIKTTTFCPGCGHGILMGLILRAIDDLDIDTKNLLFVSGIGCAAWIPSPHYNFDTLHTLHGRPIAFATGVKKFNPKLTVIVVSGDGDLVDIGGNHLIHAAWRNIDMTVICANNMVYGMTGGQACSTTSYSAITQTTSEGNPYHPIEIAKLVDVAGAAYSAKYSVTQPLQLMDSIKKAIETPGFAFIEVLSPCHTQFGRRNEFSSPVDMLKHLMEKCITMEEAELLSEQEVSEYIITGEFKHERS